MQANRNIHLYWKKHPFANYLAAKHPKAENLGLQAYDKTHWTVGSIIPCLYTRVTQAELSQLHTHRRTQLLLSMHCTFAYTARAIADLQTDSQIRVCNFWF